MVIFQKNLITLCTKVIFFIGCEGDDVKYEIENVHPDELAVHFTVVGDEVFVDFGGQAAEPEKVILTMKATVSSHPFNFVGGSATPCASPPPFYVC
jgi:hypothetical protein